MLNNEISELIKGNSLSLETTQDAFDKIMNGTVSDIEKSAFLTALTIKGENIAEITAAADIMRKYCTRVPHNSDALEIVGTGGDKSNSFNISTTSAIVLSAAGVPVAKHGNRAASSKCGAMDVLESLGVNLDITPEKSGELLDKLGLCFLFAQKYHSAMRHVGPVRSELGFRTIFNLVGPLSNPAFPKYQLMGVYSEELVEPLAEVLHNVGVENVMVAYGKDVLDEISLCDETVVCEIIGGVKKSYVIAPEDIGLKRCEKSELVGGSPEENAKITLDILNGVKNAKRDAVVLNSAYAYHVVHPEVTPLEAKTIIEETIDSGKAAAKLAEFINASREAIPA